MACHFGLTFKTFCVSFGYTDRERNGAGALGVAQHAKAAGVLSAGSAGHRHGEETCKKKTNIFFN